MRDRFCGLRLRQAVVHRPIEVRGQLRNLPRCDERADGDETAVAGRKILTQPQVSEEHVGGVLHDARRHRAELLSDARGALCLGGLVEGKKLW